MTAYGGRMLKVICTRSSRYKKISVRSFIGSCTAWGSLAGASSTAGR